MIYELKLKQKGLAELNDDKVIGTFNDINNEIILYKGLKINANNAPSLQHGRAMDFRNNQDNFSQNTGVYNNKNKKLSWKELDSDAKIPGTNLGTPLSTAGRICTGTSISGTQDIFLMKAKKDENVEENWKTYNEIFPENTHKTKKSNNVKTTKKDVTIDATSDSQQENVPKKDALKIEREVLKFPHNRIVFGAPGTGKSHMFKENIEEINKGITDENLKVDFERVTFYPEYTYSDFVGVYKPCMKGSDIEYKFVEGPILKVLKKSYIHPETNHILLIEEINRANMAAVFGDVFQLLDRNEKGESEYCISISKDVKDYLEKVENVDDNMEILKEKTKAGNIKIPSNMYIWATMNSADQGVYPMDTAFKRRWTFEYIDIDNNETFNNGNIESGQFAGNKWNDIRKTINNQLIENGINEDKCLGAFFLNSSEVASHDFDRIFTSKVLMYLFEDVVKQNSSIVFYESTRSFSKICNKYRNDGIQVFCSNIKNKIIEQANHANNNSENPENTVENNENAN